MFNSISVTDNLTRCFDLFFSTKCIHSFKIVLENDESEDPENVVKHFVMTMNLEDKLQLNSQLYTVVHHQYQPLLFEVYRISSNKGISIKMIDQLAHNYIWERRRNLQGLQLRVSYIHKHFSYSLNQNNLSLTNSTWDNRGIRNHKASISINILKILMQDLNFTAKMMSPKEQVYGSFNPKTKQWSGIWGQLVAGECDLSINFFSITKHHSKLGTFSAPLIQDSNRLYMKKPTISVSLTAYVKVFSTKFLIVSGITGLCCAVAISIFFLKGSVVSRLGTGSAVATLSLLNMDISLAVGDATRLSKRIAFLTICLSGSVVFCAFNAGLISSLMVEEYELPIKTLKDLLESPNHQIMVLRGSPDLEYFSEAADGVPKAIYNKMIKDKPREAYIDTYEEAETKMLQADTNVLFQGDVFFEFRTKEPCRFVRSNEHYFTRDMAMPFTKNSPYVALFSNRLLKALEAGLIQRNIDAEKNQRSSLCEDDPFKPLSYNSIISTFVILCFGTGLSYSILVIEIVVSRRMDQITVPP